MVGSSPRVRGKLLALHISVAQARIIPARAGQTFLQFAERAQVADHPRACGANSDSSSFFARAIGSSPRVRGKRKPLRSSRSTRRIIPARAGQTDTSVKSRNGGPDHPRACGANRLRSAYNRAVSGSSPRVRGKHAPTLRVATRSRIIPARAGQTQNIPVPLRRSPDHPRACGANLPVHTFQQYRAGSSPRVRGKRCPARITHLPQRIIPARAGQTGHRPEPTVLSSDHPRACGANIVLMSDPPTPAGSSPRVRGKLVVVASRSSPFRIIPARAGQTCF